MNNFFDKLSKIPLYQKVLLAAMLLGGLVLGYWQFFYGEMEEDFKRVETEYGKLETERKDYEKRKSEYLAFRQEVQKLTEEQKELLKVLPKTSEIPSFLEGIHTQGVLAGLEIISFNRLDEQAQDVYVRIPVSIEARGNYHQITKFAHSVGGLKRIVNIENLELTSPTGRDGVIVLAARFNASTYRFKEQPARKR